MMGLAYRTTSLISWFNRTHITLKEDDIQCFYSIWSSVKLTCYTMSLWECLQHMIQYQAHYPYKRTLLSEISINSIWESYYRERNNECIQWRLSQDNGQMLLMIIRTWPRHISCPVYNVHIHLFTVKFIFFILSLYGIIYAYISTQPLNYWTIRNILSKHNMNSKHVNINIEIDNPYIDKLVV